MEVDAQVKRFALLVLGRPQTGSKAPVELKLEDANPEFPGGCVRLFQFAHPPRDGHGPIELRVSVETWMAAIQANI